MQTLARPLQASDGHRWTLLARIPGTPRAALLWLPAMGVAAKHYIPFAEALAARGIAVFLHEWRGIGSSSLRADRRHDWGFRELLDADIPQSAQAMAQALDAVPKLIGGHSLGGQLACCHASLHPWAFRQLWLVATGNPHWRTFPFPRRLSMLLAFHALDRLAQLRGRLNGRRLRVAGVEARSVIRDWSRVGRSNRYAAAGMDVDFESALAQLALPSRSALFARDWMAPGTSLLGLTGKLAPAQRDLRVFDDATLGARADHFGWMKRPERVVEFLAQ